MERWQLSSRINRRLFRALQREYRSLDMETFLIWTVFDERHPLAIKSEGCWR